ncbi:MAG: hypothetical protein M3227_01300, partial [Thermoproteota archaeon]|nr:hypothetical protein [Thermoproteota archaeon]
TSTNCLIACFQCLCDIINYIYKNKQLCYKMASDSNNSNTNKKRVSKKGILLTALIVAGIIGTSFIVYFIP